MKRFAWQIAAIVGGLALLTGCRSTYYSTMEKFGYHKRDILVDRVKEAQTAQEQAKTQFLSALEQFAAVVGYQGGDLEATYKRLKSELDRSEEKAQAVHKRIDNVEEVAKALFREWEKEIEQYTNANLKRLSEQKLEQTQERYARLISAMRRAESRIDPVLAAFRDQVLFLKHNLNAQAIGSLEDELASVKTDVSALVTAMETSINEANDFVQAMSQK